MAASVLATSAWHLSRRDEQGPTFLAAVAPVDRPVQRSAAAPTGPPPTVAGTTRAAAPPPATKPASRPAVVPARATTTSPAAPTTGPADNRKVVPEARPYGPWQCQDVLAFDLKDPVLTRPCHALGPGIQALGRVAAPAGARATITLSLRDVATGRTVAGPHACRPMTFTGQDLTGDCGPVRLTALRGHRYQVVLDWKYTRHGTSKHGSAPGDEFTW
jgi:serine/threonine-protein kinase